MPDPAASVSGRQRIAAVVALLAAVLTIAVAVVEAISDFPEGLGVLGLIAIALGAAWFGPPPRQCPARPSVYGCREPGHVMAPARIHGRGRRGGLVVAAGLSELSVGECGLRAGAGGALGADGASCNARGTAGLEITEGA